MASSSVLGSSDTDNVYNRVFWLSYIANLAMVAANSLTFHFAELVKFLGGTEETVGWIVSVGTIGAIAARLILGQMLDRYGTRLVWAGSALLFVAACTSFMFCREISWIIFLTRIGFATGIAGMATSSIVHIQLEVPWHRRTEVIGNFGSSGFIGMVLGSVAGDILYASITDMSSRFRALFCLAGLCAVIVLVLAIAVTHQHKHEKPHVTPNPLLLIRRYWPGMIVLVGMMIGVSLTVITVFLTRMSSERGLGGIGLFFFGYCGSAFIFRVSSSTWSQRFGRRWLVLMGLAGHALGHIILAHSTRQWHLIFPAITSGFGHAMLFPSVVSIGSGCFPKQYRGSGTTVVLGFTEIGMVVSSPVLGWIIDHFRRSGWADPFAPMFYASAGWAVFAGIAYWWSSRGKPDEEQQQPRSYEGESLSGVEPDVCITNQIEITNT